jgi:hypothetical protein
MPGAIMRAVRTPCRASRQRHIGCVRFSEDDTELRAAPVLVVDDDPKIVTLQGATLHHYDGDDAFANTVHGHEHPRQTKR